MCVFKMGFFMNCSLDREQGASNNGNGTVFGRSGKRQSFVSLMLASSILFFPSMSFSYQDSNLTTPPEIVTEQTETIETIDFADSDFDSKIMELPDDLLDVEAMEEEYQPEAGVLHVEIGDPAAVNNDKVVGKAVDKIAKAKENPVDDSVGVPILDSDLPIEERGIQSEKNVQANASVENRVSQETASDNLSSDTTEFTEIVAEDIDEDLPELPELDELPNMEIVNDGDDIPKAEKTIEKTNIILKPVTEVETGSLDVKSIENRYTISPKMSKDSLLIIKKIESKEQTKLDSAQEEYEKEIERINSEYSKKMELLNKMDMKSGDIDSGNKLLKLNNKPKLSEEVIKVLEKIPANKIVKEELSIEPASDVKINRRNSSSVLPEFLDEDIKANNRPDVGIKMHQADKEDKVFDNIGKAYDAMESGDNDIAIAYYKMALSQDEKSFEARFGLATIYQMINRLDQAKEIYLDLLEEDQSNWDVLNNFLVLAGQEASDDTIRQLQKLEVSNPEFAPIPEQLGLIYTDKKKYKIAIRKLVRAVKLDPENNQYRYNLALVLEHVDDIESAGKIYQQLLYAARRGKKLPVSAAVIQRKLENIASKIIHN